MKKMGKQMRMEKTRTTTAKRGMARREKEKRFMMIPPNSIPRAAAGRFTAPARNGAIRGALPAQNPSMGREQLSRPHRSWENPQIQLLSNTAQTQGSWKVTKVNPRSHPKMYFQ